MISIMIFTIFLIDFLVDIHKGIDSFFVLSPLSGNVLNLEMLTKNSCMNFKRFYFTIGLFDQIFVSGTFLLKENLMFL